MQITYFKFSFLPVQSSPLSYLLVDFRLPVLTCLLHGGLDGVGVGALVGSSLKGGGAEGGCGGGSGGSLRGGSGSSGLGGGRGGCGASGRGSQACNKHKYTSSKRLCH